MEGDGCGFFLWCDQAKRYVLPRRQPFSSRCADCFSPCSMGRDFTTPPPPEPRNYVQPTDAQRRRPSPPAFSAAPAGRPPPSPSTSPVKGSQTDAERAAREVLHDFEDIDFDAPGNVVGREDEDDIVDDAESPVAAGPASPAKRPRFDSFTGPPSPQTPSKKGTAGPDRAAARQGFAAIQADPDSPFHALQRTLFSSGQSTSATTSASVSPDKSSASTPGDPFSALEQALNPLASLFEAAKKEHDKDTRLLLAAKRKEETLRKTYEKERSERERFQRDNEALKNRIK